MIKILKIVIKTIIVIFILLFMLIICNAIWGKSSVERWLEQNEEFEKRIEMNKKERLPILED